MVLRDDTVECRPFEDDAFDLALAINSMQAWPDVDAGLREIRRVDGRLARAFTPRSGQPRAGVMERLAAAGYADPAWSISAAASAPWPANHGEQWR